MRKQKAFLVASLVLVLLGMGASGCDRRCPTCTPCPPTPTPIDTSALETQVATLETGVELLQTAVAECTSTPDGDSCVEKPLCHPDAISAEQAKAYVGEMKIVQGKVVDGKFASGSGGQPTFLNLCYPYGDARRFTVLIWGEDRQEFIDCVGGLPEVILLNSEICVKGLIELYGGIPEIILTQCDQLTIIQ